jgi:PAS domain-containing protein
LKANVRAPVRLLCPEPAAAVTQPPAANDEFHGRLRAPVARRLMAGAMQVDEQPGSSGFEQLPDAIIVVDRQGIIRYANG